MQFAHRKLTLVRARPATFPFPCGTLNSATAVSLATERSSEKRLQGCRKAVAGPAGRGGEGARSPNPMTLSPRWLRHFMVVPASRNPGKGHDMGFGGARARHPPHPHLTVPPSHAFHAFRCWLKPMQGQQRKEGVEVGRGGGGARVPPPPGSIQAYP